MLKLVKAEIGALKHFYEQPTLANFRRLKAELACQGISVEQAFPDLQAFLAWKGKSHLYSRILLEEEKSAK